MLLLFISEPVFKLVSCIFKRTIISFAFSSVITGKAEFTACNTALPCTSAVPSIPCPSGLQSSTSGDYRDMQASAEALKEFNAGIINAYVRKTGKTREELQALMAGTAVTAW